MTVFRKILKVKTTGSRATGDLRPAFSDAFPQKYAGINYVVHEYNEAEGWCVVEAWCSNHPILPPNHIRDMSHLEELAKNPHVIEVLNNHPLSPPILGELSYGSPFSPKKVDLEKKEITVEVVEEGIASERVVPFKRIEKAVSRLGGTYNKYVLDEG